MVSKKQLTGANFIEKQCLGLIKLLILFKHKRIKLKRKMNYELCGNFDFVINITDLTSSEIYKNAGKLQKYITIISPLHLQINVSILEDILVTLPSKELPNTT